MDPTVQELPQDTWVTDFQRIYVDGIDTQLIGAVVETLSWAPGDHIACSIARMMSICTDKGKWIYAPKKTGGRKKGRYWRLRKVSDFLGLPPWLLLLTDFNALLYTLFELKSAKFDEYPLINFGIAVTDASKYLDVVPLTKDQRENFRRDVARIASDFHEMVSYRRGDSELPDSFYDLYKMASSFTGEYSFSIKVPIPTHTGAKKNAHVRLVQGILPEFKDEKSLNKSHFWRSGWISVVLEEPHREVYEGGIDEIVRLVSKPFEVNPVKLTRTVDGKVFIVYSWHSLRFRLLSTQTKSDLEGKLSKVPLTMNHLIEVSETDPARVIDLNTDLLNLPDEFIRLIKWMSLDVPKECRPSSQDIEARFRKYQRRQNSLDILFQAGYLKDGTTLEFIPTTLGGTPSEVTNSLLCEVVSENGNPYVTWRSERYSITGLTQAIMKLYNVTNVDFKHLNGNTYWRKCGDDKSLYHRANELVRSNATRVSLESISVERAKRL